MTVAQKVAQPERPKRVPMPALLQAAMAPQKKFVVVGRP
jgi:hypothetical protein